MKYGIATAVSSALLVMGAAHADTDTSAQIERKFRALDANGDGVLSATEASAMDRLEEDPTVPGRTHVRYSFAELDLDGNGSLARTEVAFKPELAANFAYADRNGNGTLNRTEFESAVALSAEMFGEGERSVRKRRIFRSLDMDGNAVVSKSEVGNGNLDMGEFAGLSLEDLGGAAAGGTARSK